MSDIKRLHVGPRMSKIVTHNGVAYLAGLVGNEDQSLAAQTADILDQIDSLLAEVGSNKERILRIEIWLADMGDFAAMNEIYDAWVPAGHNPARACGESALATPNFKVEMIVTAAL